MTLKAVLLTSRVTPNRERVSTASVMRMRRVPTGNIVTSRVGVATDAEKGRVQRDYDAIVIMCAESTALTMMNVATMLIVNNLVSGVARYATLGLTSAAKRVRCAWLDVARLDAQMTLMTP